MLGLGRCSHQFCWPRRAATGEYYQVCVHCGQEYLYDWDSMRRLGRKRKTKAATTSVTKRNTIIPRADRMSLSGPVRYRDAATQSWNEGELRNISESGVLFAGHSPLRQGTRIELELIMPAQICGSEDAQVKCNAEVVRAGEEDSLKVYAAQIFDYVFINSSAAQPEISPGRRAKCTPGQHTDPGPQSGA